MPLNKQPLLLETPPVPVKLLLPGSPPLWTPLPHLFFPWNKCPESVDGITNAYRPGRGFPHSSVSKESACNAGDLGLIPGLGRSPGEGNGNPLQYSCLENPMGRRAWWATVHGVTKSRTQLSDLTSLHTLKSESVSCSVVSGFLPPHVL